MPVILNRQQDTAGPVPKQNGDRARMRVLPPCGFFFIEVNENPGGKVQLSELIYLPRISLNSQAREKFQ